MQADGTPASISFPRISETISASCLLYPGAAINSTTSLIAESVLTQCEDSLADINVTIPTFDRIQGTRFGNKTTRNACEKP
jgi:hypothetical protein